MDKFSSYHIVHWYLNEPYPLLTRTGKSYVCCWWKQIPIGHIWIETGIHAEHIDSEIKKAIRPALEHYLANMITSVAPLLEEQNYHQLNVLMEQATRESREFQPVPEVSVIVCTRNRPDALEVCLKHLALCTGNLEVIVVDNAPDSSLTRKLVAQFPNIKYVEEPRPGLDIARNTGIRHACYDIVAYTDDDVIVPPNWIENISRAFTDPLTMAVTGLVFPYELETQAQVIFEKKWSFNKGYLPKKFDHSYFLAHQNRGVPAWEIGAGANMAFRKNSFLLTGFFDERLDAGAAGCSGDSEMWFRILAKGWNCSYLPHIYVYHQHRHSLAELKKQLFNYMKGHVSALLIQHENYPQSGNLNRLYKELPRYYLRQIAARIFNRNNHFLLSQLKGCIAGWKYYHSRKKKTQGGITEFLSPGEAKKDFKNCVVSVVITCYNLGHFLTEAIESVLGQTHLLREIIVVDDGSTDETANICNRYANKVRYIKTNRVGLSAARNKGSELATGQYIVFLDADDFLYPQALEVNGYFFGFYQEMQMVSGAHTIVNRTSEVLETPAFKTTLHNNYISLLHGNYIAMEGAVMYRKHLFDYFHFDTDLEACEDYDLNLRLARHFPVFGHDKVIAAYRKHGDNMSLDKNKMKRNALKVLKAQEKVLINQEERLAWEKGLKNWENYYADER